MLGNKVLKNAAWIIVGKVVQSILTVVVTMLSSRYLGPSGYGIINYAASIVAFFVPVMQLGLNGILVYEIVNNPEQEGEILGTATVMSFFSSVLCVLGVISFCLIANTGERQTIIVCGLYSIVLVFQALEMVQFWFQAKLKSKYTAIVMLLAYVVVAIYKIVLLVKKKGLFWFALSQALDYAIISILLLIIYKKLGGKKFVFSRQFMKAMFAKSKYYIIAGVMATVFTSIDKVMIKLIIGNVATGYYAAAVSGARMANFVFSAIIDSARPTILENRKLRQEQFEKNTIRLFSVVIYLSLLQCIFITTFSPVVVKILYGAEYLPTVNVLRLLVWYTMFAYISAVRDIWMLGMGYQKYLLILNLSGAIMNIVLNAVLIPLWGIMGAALATLLTQIFTNVFMNIIIKPLRKSNLLMIKSLNPKILFEILGKKNR